MQEEKNATVTQIFNQVFLEKHTFLHKTTTYPTCLKLAKSIPLFKKADRSRPEIYHPISLISSLSKVLEKLLLERMVSFCQKHKILKESQFGSRSKMSCVQANPKLTEFLHQQYDDKMTQQACFIDLKKAFDTLDHEICLKKLENCAFR